MNVHTLGDAFFDRLNRHDPLGASLVGLTAYDALLPDPRAAADEAAAASFQETVLAFTPTDGDAVARAFVAGGGDAVARAFVAGGGDAVARTFVAGGGDTRARSLTPAGGDAHALVAGDGLLPGGVADGFLPGGAADGDDIDRDVLRWMAGTAAEEATHCLWEANASATAYASPQALFFMAGSAQRLHGAAAFFDGLADRYREASGRGRPSTRAGIAQAVTQLDEQHARFDGNVRAAMQRLVETLRGELSAVARDDEHVGILHVRGGEDGYRAAVAAHTTTDLTPREVHDLGLRLLADLEAEWSRLGQQVFGVGDPAAVRARLRDDPALRFTTGDEIVTAVAAALDRAHAAFPGTARCLVEPVDDPAAPPAYYLPPAADGSRAGTVCVVTTDPGQRSTFGSEALAFHEGVPGHHLQAVASQALMALPDYRRYVDTRLGAYVEGWALYAEQVAEDLDLYSSPLARLGRVSFAAVRAGRLVADTGMHAYGWSREQARVFVRAHTALSAAGVAQEVDRYIGWPGQALAYSVGAGEILRLRTLSQAALGPRFRLEDFHQRVLGSGAVPIGALATIIDRWVRS
ncbi:DUF885 domain-containing protein [Actinoplanes sp. NPDC051494]|uniref:DUF885 domain-containing protein n=1 Tax=Actinoplanes sp. NPDC051494 TaxID=3363907 RepID=UPI003795BAEA